MPCIVELGRVEIAARTAIEFRIEYTTTSRCVQLINPMCFYLDTDSLLFRVG